jgi:translation elongation factor EF-Ts
MQELFPGLRNQKKNKLIIINTNEGKIIKKLDEIFLLNKEFIKRKKKSNLKPE